MIVPLVLLLSVLGIALNLGLSATLAQPDWALSLLLAALLARRGHWNWVLPAVWLHDVSLYWSPLVNLPVFLWIPVALIWSDEQLGPAVPQRIVLMTLATLPLLWAGWGFVSWLLTWLLCFCSWYLMTRIYFESA